MIYVFPFFNSRNETRPEQIMIYSIRYSYIEAEAEMIKSS